MRLRQFSKEELRRQNIVVVIIILVGIMVAFGVHHVFNSDLRPVDKNNHQRVEVVIPRGSTDKEVAARLKRHGLIRNAYVFDYYLQTHKSNGVKAGHFILKKSMSTPELVEHLQQTRYAHHK